MTEQPDSSTPAAPPAATPATAAPATPAAAVPTATDPISAAVAPGYQFEGPALELGGLMLDATTLSDVHIRIPLAMLNRHGLVAGATGTGKTKTLQLMAEQLAAAGVPVFAADMKGDLSGVSSYGVTSDKIIARAASVGQSWTSSAYSTEFFAIGGKGTGIPLRVSMSAFGPTLLSRVLGLNDTQESSLGLVFHYADQNGLTLVDLNDLRAVVQYLSSDEGKGDLKDLGGLSSATAGVILRELIAFADQGADAFFGETEMDTRNFLRMNTEGQGVISLVELPALQEQPQVFSTFLMWLLADLFHELPEVGDIDKPKLVFFFDEAHLLFDGASKAFLQSIEQTVRLIRSKGVGVFFITQSPTDVPDNVLAQLGSRIQHQLRAHTPDDAKALRATVNTYPTSAYDDLGKVITSLGIGEAIVTVMNENGAPTPVAWTRLRAPETLMSAATPESMEQRVQQSALYATYATPVDPDSAREMLARKLEAGAAKQQAEEPTRPTAAPRASPTPKAPSRAARRGKDKSVVGEVMGSTAFRQVLRTTATEIVRGMFKTGRR